MQKQEFTAEISAPAAIVYDVMLGKETYPQWTAPFNPTSDFEGSWETGEKIRFIGLNKEGRKEGMVARIEQNDPNRYVAIKHLGLLDGEKEILEGPQVEGWAGALETYTFTEENGKTTVNVEVDVNEQYASYMSETWPKALSILKQISERA